MIATQYSLVDRMRDGVSDRDWQRFYALYERPILAFTVARSLNEADCRDVLQETMIKMLRGGFARFDPEKGRFTGFLFNVARCCVIDALRRRNRREARHLPLGMPGERAFQLAEHGPDNPADEAERHGQMALVSAALEFLIQRKCFEPMTIELFKAAAFAQREPKEIAATFSTSVGNVYQARHTVLRKLRTVLDGLERGFDLEQASGI